MHLCGTIAQLVQDNGKTLSLTLPIPLCFINMSIATRKTDLNLVLMLALVQGNVCNYIELYVLNSGPFPHKRERIFLMHNVMQSRNAPKLVFYKSKGFRLVFVHFWELRIIICSQITFLLTLELKV